jgi:hypothetical protein
MAILREAWKLVFAAFFGAVMAVVAMTAWTGGGLPTQANQGILYAIGMLAVDTEKNAERIVELQDQVYDLQQSLREAAARE